MSLLEAHLFSKEQKIQKTKDNKHKKDEINAWNLENISCQNTEKKLYLGLVRY
jgi:hypothetical protein